MLPLDLRRWQREPRTQTQATMTTTLIAPLLDPQMREPREGLLSVDPHLQDRRQDPLDFPEDPPTDLQEDHQEGRLADPLDLRLVDHIMLPKADHTYPGHTHTTRHTMHHPGLTMMHARRFPSTPSPPNRHSSMVPTPTPVGDYGCVVLMDLVYMSDFC